MNPTARLILGWALVFMMGMNLSSYAQRPGSYNSDDRPPIASISGRVIDAASKSPIPFASVVLMNVRDSIITSGTLADESGQFEMTELPLGKYILQVQFMGFESFSSLPIMLTPRTTIAHDAGVIELNPKINALEEAVIIEESSSLEMLIDRRVFHVGNDLSAAGGTASELLVNVPSVMVDIDGNISLRGSSQVQILIDGRPSGMSGAARNAFLEQIPASSIDRIEVITNPSAKYDPDGMAGILNIILKKNKLSGFHGQAQATPATGDNYNASLSLNYKDSRFSVFSSLSWNQRDQFRTGHVNRSFYAMDSTSVTTQIRDGNNLNTSLSGRLGMEWYPTESEVISWNINLNQNQRSGINLLKNEELWDTGTSYATLRESFDESVGSGWDLDGSYRKEFNQDPRHFLFAQVRHSRSFSDASEFIMERPVMVSSFPDFFAADTNLTLSAQTRTVAQIDFEKPLPNDGKLEWGLKSNMSLQNDEFGYLRADSSEWINGIYLPINPEKAGFDFLYREDVHAIYSTLGRKWGVWGFQGGLRLEQVFTSSEWGMDQRFNNDYFSAYPSFNVSRQIDDEVSWMGSYSRRVNRPRSRSVTPFLDDSDSRNLRIGNPELMPEYTHSMEFGHQWSRNRTSLTTSLFRKTTTDIIQRYSTINEVGIRTSTWINQGSSTHEGAEIIAMVPIPGGGQMRFTGSLYHLNNQVGDVEFASDVSGWSYNLNFFANQSWGKGKTWKWQLNGMYRGPSVTTQGQFNGYAFLDANIQKSLLDGDLTIALKLSDVFNTREWSYISDLPGLYQTNLFKRESQNLFLTLTWKLGHLEERQRGSNRGRNNGDFDGGGDMEF